MSNHKYLFPTLIGGAVVTLALKGLTAGHSHSKPVFSSTPYAEIDRYVEAQMARLSIPGAALAIVEGGQIVHARGFGQVQPGGEAPSPQTPFFIGSLTKSITALAVMQLVEAGKIELDALVQRYLPWFRVADPQASAQIRVRQLLNQTSGLSAVAGSIALADCDDHPRATERQVRALSTLKLNHPPGSKWEYSNLNYNILGLIIEVVSGESYADYIQTHIFDPLEMRHSYSSRKEAKPNGLAMGYQHWFSLPVPARNLPIPQGSLASGQLISSAEDMAHYLIAHLNGGCFGDAQILSAAGIQELHRGAAEFSMGSSPAGRYAMGWFDMDIGQTKTFSHSGNVPDFSAFMALLPEQKRGVVLLLNADPYGLPLVTEEVGAGLMALLAGQQPPAIKLDFIQWIFRLLPLIPILQVVDVFATLRSIRNWRKHPQLRPSGGQVWWKHILPALIPNLALAALLGYLRSSGLFGFVQLFMPDLSWITRICGSFGGIWAVLRTGLILKALRK